MRWCCSRRLALLSEQVPPGSPRSGRSRLGFGLALAPNLAPKVDLGVASRPGRARPDRPANPFHQYQRHNRSENKDTWKPHPTHKRTAYALGRIRWTPAALRQAPYPSHSGDAPTLPNSEHCCAIILPAWVSFRTGGSNLAQIWPEQTACNPRSSAPRNRPRDAAKTASGARPAGRDAPPGPLPSESWPARERGASRDGASSGHLGTRPVGLLSMVCLTTEHSHRQTQRECSAHNQPTHPPKPTDEPTDPTNQTNKTDRTNRTDRTKEARKQGSN